MNREYLHSLLDYDIETGIFTRKLCRARKQKVGDIVGTKHYSGYIHIKIDGKTYMAHRLVWIYFFGIEPKHEIDHINGIRDDNRLLNLRECNDYEQAYNKGIYKNNTSGIKGVTYEKSSGKWVVQIRINGKNKKIGRYDCLELAGFIAEESRRKYHLEFARL